MTIYLIEDDDLYAEFLKRMIGQNPAYSISVFGSAEDCEAKLRTGNFPDAFICDYKLPGKTGIDLYEEVKEELKKSRKFIMISSLEDGSLVLSFIKKGLRDYVIKDDTVIDSLLAILEGKEDEYYHFV
jgi:DNA-binding NarL/FixJ family response regulator